MQAEVERLDTRFRRFFLWFNLGWMFVSIFSLIFSATAAFEKHPEYLHDWRGPLICILMLAIPGTFGFILLAVGRKYGRSRAQWPPPLSYSLSVYGSLYAAITILNLFDNNFVWGYFTVLGITYSFFQKQRMTALVLLTFLSFCYFQNSFAWPIMNSDWGAILGNGITFLSLTIVSITIQYLINERYERRCLLEKLTQTNEELAAAHQHLTESAAQEQELAVLRERTRLAREMHDTLGHALVLVSVKLEAAQRLRELDPQRSDRELEATKEIVRSSMKELRASIANLRSPTLEREPACRALSRYAREMAQRNDLRVAYDLHSDIEGLPENTEETLWKIGLEALTNIEKHAQARNVLLHISRQNGQIVLKIADDGIGLPAHLCEHQENTSDYASPVGHYGLSGIQERVKNAQGELSIRTNDAQGTTIEVRLPLVETPLPLASAQAEPAVKAHELSPSGQTNYAGQQLA